MIKVLALGGFAFILFIILDLIWFTVAGNFFKAEIGSIARLTIGGDWDVRLPAALLVYLLMACAVMIFVLPHATSIGTALLLGGAFGLLSFGIYDMTNLATLTAWTVRFAAVDMSWGTFVCATVSAVTYVVSKLPFLA